MHEKRGKNPKAERPKAKDKDMDALVQAAWDAGAWCERSRKQHVKVYPADGSRMVSIPNTPSDKRTYRNKRQALRRAGVSI